MIKTNAFQFENLKILLAQVFPIMLSKEGYVLHSYNSRGCGKPLCIAGEACVLPEFNERGFIPCLDSTDALVPSYLQLKGRSALDAFFGDGIYDILFSSNCGILSDHEEILKRQQWLENYIYFYSDTINRM